MHERHRCLLQFRDWSIWHILEHKGLLNRAGQEVMAGSDHPPNASGQRLPGRRAEFLTFLVLAFGVWPFVAIAVVGGFGFLVWMLQIAFGPPGPPGSPH